MKKVLLLLLSIISLSAFANEYSCVQYQRKDFSWGNAYKLPYTIVSGDQLQEVTNDYSHYKSYVNYAVVEWPNGGYSAMEMPSYRDDISDFSYSNTEDQSGRKYRIKKAPSYGECSRY